MRYYIIAGEASGDLHGSNLMKGLHAEDPEADIRFWGGELMLASGGTMVRSYKEGAVMGFTEVIAKGFKLLENIRFCKKDIVSWSPDVVILIDYPSVNMKIAKFCHRRGMRVFYYIAPRTWASRAGRNRKLRAWVDRLFIVFPFEIQYFSQRGIPFIYEGNPLIDAIDGHEYIRPADGRYIAILAGSRKAEISRMMPVCMKVAEEISEMEQFSGCKFIVAGAPARTAGDYDKYLAGHDNVQLMFDRTYDILKYADAAIVNSGTASLEAALIGTPQVVCWSTSRLTYLVAKYILRVGSHIRYSSLGNLCLDKPVFRELIQDDFNVTEVTREICRLVNDSSCRENMIADYGRIRESLGGSGASRKVARAMIEELKK